MICKVLFALSAYIWLFISSVVFIVVAILIKRVFDSKPMERLRLIRNDDYRNEKRMDFVSCL